mgnify:CR=1 FL=1
MLSINFKYILKIQKLLFPFYKKKQIKEIFNVLEKNYPKKKTIALFVGGCVRKYLEKENIDDIDIATILTTDQLKECFKDTKMQLIETGIDHGSITIINGDYKFEITTLRKDIKTDGRHAEIELTDDWLEDSNRRDFSINAIYMDRYGKIFDPHLGRKDLKNKIIKFIGEPDKRINEDYLRILRFIRFSLQYNSLDDQTTTKAIKVNLNGVKNLSKERILMELFKIFKLENFENIVSKKDLMEIFSLIFPEFANINRLKKWNLIKNEAKQSNEIILAILLISTNNNYEYFCHKYRTSNEIKNNLNNIHEAFLIFKKDKNFFKKNLKKNIYLFSKKVLKYLSIINFLDNNKFSVKDTKNNLKEIDQIILPKLPFDGQYLINRGFDEGKKIGQVLKVLEKKWIENDFSLKEDAIKIILNKNNSQF